MVSPAPPRPTPDELRAALDVLQRADFKEVQRAGFHFQANDFYSPLNDCAFLDANRDLWTDAIEPAGIDWQVERQLAVAAEVAAFVEELRDVPDESDDPAVFCWRNNFWNNADALVQYGLVRSRRPRRVIEVGCGWSSLLLARALARNAALGSPQTDVVQIEPYPRESLMASLPRHWQQHVSILQRAPLSLFDALQAGDVLFYDGSHCAKVASDVNWLFFRVLPRLKPGVLIHIHDIFLPGDYPEDWIFNRGQTWNEQYVAQAFLMHSDAYSVEISNSYLALRRPEEVRALYRGVQPAHGVSLWLRKHESRYT
jgi:predicted O-methyltransferase YrrM